MLDVIAVTCLLGTGSAVPLDANTVITAAHVTQGDTCHIAAKSLSPIQVDSRADIYVARLSSPLTSPAPTISCAPIRTGETYTLKGAQRTTRAVAIETRYDVRTQNGITYDLRGLRGRSHAGQSGGAVLNQAGEVVGIISASTADGNVGVVEFARTPLCNPST